MAFTLGSLRGHVLRLLDDPDGGGYSDDLLLDGISAAFDAILPWIPKTASIVLTGDGNTTVFDLPADLYEIEAVSSNLNGDIWPRTVLAPGQKLGLWVQEDNQWLDYPVNQITFAKPIRSGELVTILYLSYWDKPTSMTVLEEPLEPPDMALVGITLYAASYLILPSAIGVSEINPFKRKGDSGTPEHNPMQTTSKFLRDLFVQEMSRHPKHQKASR